MHFDRRTQAALRGVGRSEGDVERATDLVVDGTRGLDEGGVELTIPDRGRVRFAADPGAR